MFTGRKIVDLAASKGKILPANLLWMELLLAGKDKEANSIWQQCLSNSDVVVFRRLLQQSFDRKEPQLIEKLIALLKTNTKLSGASIGNAYSRLINLHLVLEDIDKAKASLDKAYESGVTNQHINKTSLNRLNAALESAGKV